MTMLLNAETTGSSQPDERGLIDCSLHPSIKDKPAQFRQEFSRSWQQHSLNLLELRQHVSTGGAFIPAAMTSSKRSSQAFRHADLAVIDIDGGLSIDDFLRHELASHAAWIYTTCSHQSGSGSDRFRIVFRLPERITDPEQYKQILNALSSELGGDKSCTDPCRLFYGNSAALHPLFSPDRTLSSEVTRELGSKHHRAPIQKQNATAEYNEITIAQAEYVLEHVLEGTADGERDLFIKVTAAACSAGDALLAAWQSWASRCHHTSGYRAKQGTDRFFHSFSSTRSSVTTLFFLASEQDPDWREGLPDELRSAGYSLAPSHKAVGYDHEDFLHGGMDNPDFGMNSIPVRDQNDTTQSLFDKNKAWATPPNTLTTEGSDAYHTWQHNEPDTCDSLPESDEPFDDDDNPFDDDDNPFDDDVDPGFSFHPPDHHEEHANNTEAHQIHSLIQQHFPRLRLNKLTQKYEYFKDGITTEIEDITAVYIEIAPYLAKIPPKTAVTDMARHFGRKHAYHPVMEYLNFCGENVEPWPDFDKVATEILGLPDDPTHNPTLANGRSLGDVVIQRFLVAAVARIFEPGCSLQ
jgi:hypothetical protein